MKYENAKDVLPAELLKALQQHASGKLLYVPVDEDKRPWGEGSGYREKLRKRNQMIRNKYTNGTTVSELADEYFLSLDSVKKIIYGKQKEDYIMYSPSLQSAVAYADNGMVEEWVLSNLLFTHDHPELYEKFMAESYIYFGVAKLPLRFIDTDQGQNQGQKQGQNQSQSHQDQQISPCQTVDDYDTSPLIVSYIDGVFSLPVDENRPKLLKERKINAYPAVILMKGIADHKRFMTHYGRHLMFVSQD